MAARRSAWSSPASGRIRMLLTRARRMDGRGSSASWSRLPERWTEMSAKTVAYWTTTILVAAPIGSGGVAQIAQYFANPHGVVPVLGYPLYFFFILGIWKALGAIAILAPGYPRLKEWAYAGIF